MRSIGTRIALCDLGVHDFHAGLAEEGVSPETVKHLLRATIAWQRYQKERQQAR
jgi:hypothetical protein